MGINSILNVLSISSRFFIQKTSNDAKTVLISPGHIKLKEWRVHGFILPSAFSEGSRMLVDCRIIELAAFLTEKS